MPIQIRELIVTATVEETSSSKSAPKTQAEAKGAEQDMKQEIVQACVDEVMKILKQQTRR